MANIKETYAQRHYESALDYFEQGNYDKALQQIDNAIQKSPNNPDYYSTKGVFLHRMNDIPKAISAYQKAIEVFPGHTFSHYNLGIIFMKDGKILQAIQQWEEVIKNKPDDVDSIFNIAVALSKLGKAKQAIPFYKKVLEYDPCHVMTHQNLAVIYRDECDYAQAKYHFNILKDLDTTYSEVVDKEIFRCEEQEFLAKIEEEKKQTANFIGTGDNSDMGKALSALIKEDFDNALDFANIILSDSPDDKNALLVKAQALAGKYKDDEALKVLNKVVELYPEEIEAYFQMGTISMNLGKYSQAMDYFQKIKKIDANYPLIDENIDIARKYIINGGQNI
jgi:tetratricopeptide (TPR) repeat protein